MVILNWEGKSDISQKIEHLKKEFLNKFEIIETLIDSWQEKISNSLDPQNWVNKLFWGNNFEVLTYLLNNFENKIDLIYVDPPFFSGVNYEIYVEEEGQMCNEIAYYDHWEKDLNSYLQMLYERILLFHKLLSKKGLIFVHLDWHAAHYIRVILDEIFGYEKFVNDIVWYYYNKYSAGKKNLPRSYDNILVYSKSDKYTFNQLRIPRKKPIKQLKRKMINGVLKNVKDDNGHVVYRIVDDKKLDDVWKIPCMQPASKEWTGFPTQKHHELLERIIELGSNEGDLIADLFCGSGTSILSAEKLKRRWIGCDISEYSIYLTRRRILDWQNNIKDTTKNQYAFEIYTILNEKKKKIIESDFFNKKIIIKRKK